MSISYFVYKILHFFNIPSILLRIYSFIIEVYYKILNKKTIQIELFNGKKMILEINDRGLSQDLILSKNKIREKYASEYLIDYFRKNKGKTFFDLGSNLGYYPIILSDYFENIISVEPVKSSSKICLENAKLNDFIDKMKHINGAISYEKGYGECVNNKHKNWTKIKKTNKKTNCELYTISEVCEKFDLKKIDLLKMDLEGGEYDIIVKGREHLFKYPPKKIFVEIHFDLFNEKEIKEIFTILKKEKYLVDRVFIEIKNRDNLLGPFGGIYNKIQKKLLKNMVGEIYNNVTIDTILNEDSIIKSKRAIEFIFSK